VRIQDGGHEECKAGDQEGGTVSRLLVGCTQKNRVAYCDSWSAQNHKHLPLVYLGADARDKQRKERSDGIRRNGVELLRDSRGLGINGSDNCREEEG
jgi:hypothetical protein